jgi:acetylornithine deacetylase/succinyl-diaminopimelate desuccinylase-like protein
MYLAKRNNGVQFRVWRVTRFPGIRNEKATGSQYFQLHQVSDRQPAWIGFQTVGPARCPLKPHGRLADVRRALALAAGIISVTAVTAGSTRQHASAGDARIEAAARAIRASEGKTIDDQVRLCEVPAPPFGERARGALTRDMLNAAGLKNVQIDRAGNVLGDRPGRSARPSVVLAAHLDTVFPEGTPVKVTRAGSTLRGPGIADNCRGLAVLVAVARALQLAGVQTAGTIIFAATVGEEGLGDLRGARTLLGDTLKGRADRFVALDGSGESITNIAVGSRRYRFTFRGSGGHSYNNFGRANPAHALGRAVAQISELHVPAQPKTTFSVGRIGGGTSVNAIPAEAWFEIDLRSTGEGALSALDQAVQKIVNNAVARENARWKQNGALTVTSVRVGDRPAGSTDGRTPIVQTAQSISTLLGMTAVLGEASTDANVAMQLGIPAIAIGGGGRGTATHTLNESFDAAGSHRGTERALRLVIALARP